MKKTFVKPTLKSYGLNNQENIVASITWNDGKMTAQWNFHQYDPGTGNLITGAEGCFNMLDNSLATNHNRLTYEGSWNAWIARLSRYDDPDSPDYQSESALADWTAYAACRVIPS